jgi:hypothetical protein
MKEHPILFSTEMVKAIIDGYKTMTRRAKGLELVNQRINESWRIGETNIAGRTWWEAAIDSSHSHRIDSPYGQVGDRLWVRETWNSAGGIGHGKQLFTPVIRYKADGYSKSCEGGNSNSPIGIDNKWRPSIFMPRWASRITLKITNIRVERLQDISLGDLSREGVQLKQFGFDNMYSKFEHLWNTINAKRGYSWESNPWVWVIEFKKI